ncbi:MAG: hypothetical protein KKG94_00825 [Nanoarchaeota archaeon]|nr:hypothetical protein [Nanoarchaeota archaeon]
MIWKVITTKTFSKAFKKYKKDSEFTKVIEQKIKRFKENPHNVGGNLSGKLKGYKSTRIIRKFRLLFKIVADKVYLISIDHRKFDYKRF